MDPWNKESTGCSYCGTYKDVCYKVISTGNAHYSGSGGKCVGSGGYCKAPRGVGVVFGKYVAGESGAGKGKGGVAGEERVVPIAFIELFLRVAVEVHVGAGAGDKSFGKLFYTVCEQESFCVHKGDCEPFGGIC